MKNHDITRFRGEHAFLSNFYPAPIIYQGKRYPTAEHLFQALKTIDAEEREAIRKSETPAEAKARGRKATLRPGWDYLRHSMMLWVVQEKFKQNPKLKRLLIATGDVPLIEGNTWGDKYWGQVDGVGHNYLGKILMGYRSRIKGVKTNERNRASNR